MEADLTNLTDSFRQFESIIYDALENEQSSIVKGVKWHLGNMETEEENKSIQSSGADPGADRIPDKNYKNWSTNIQFTPKYTYYPRNREDIINCVKIAKEEGLKIRCAAEGHTWSSLSMTHSFLLILDENLSDITIEKYDNGDWVVHAEAGAQISKIDKILKKNEPPLTIESMTVLDTVSIGGVVATGSHGAKTQSRTIAEQVVGLEIVDANGDLRKFSDEINPEEMAAARVNLGLLGIIYRVSLRVKPMYNLRMSDTYPKLATFSKEDLKKLVMESDGVEIFYWPFNASNKSTDSSQDSLMVKRWTESTDEPTLNKLELALYRAAQKAATYFANYYYKLLILDPNSTPYYTHLISSIKSPERDMVWQAPDAIHYQAGIDNILCQDMEFAIKVDDDFGNVITELNYIVDQLTAYDEDPEAYYFFPEVLSINDTKFYGEFCQNIAKRWIDKYKARLFLMDGHYCTRPHWAKSWEDIPNIKDYLHGLLKERTERFEKVRKNYDPNGMFFDNDSIRYVFYGSP
ncbi:FAD-binding domain-containing protein [Rhizophagus irregularis]|uniref:D-arabinono-1,4-lactone oxidase n=2 Tax=Rhizophagus irregularis TaxID=588596 RepID=A0A2N0S706_9GLOM|nr:FAD-binding domain-containing protein [Rhizophagus irregularis]